MPGELFGTHNTLRRHNFHEIFHTGRAEDHTDLYSSGLALTMLRLCLRLRAWGVMAIPREKVTRKREILTLIF